jgi:hypothetical protein
LEYIIFVGTIILILVTGFVKLRRSIDILIEKHNFVHEYQEKFIQFVTSYLKPGQFSLGRQSSLDQELYHWLVSNMDKTQRLLGHFGRGHYIAPFGRFQHPNYEYILNTVNQIATNDAEREDLSMCNNMMVRYLGAMTRLIDDEEKRIKNPVIWLQQGIQFYLGFPIRLLNWFGIISDSSFNRVTSSQPFKILSGVGGLVAFFASLIQIFQAWPFIIGLFSK